MEECCKDIEYLCEEICKKWCVKALEIDAWKGKKFVVQKFDIFTNALI